MLKLRRSDERGKADHGWLQSHHSFSFAEYYDPNHMGFRSLRVINEDFIAGGRGFGMHPHADMEIITYVIQGSLEHKDSMGNSTIIRPNEVQRMSAGTGVWHSEHNSEPKQATHLLQIWIIPERQSGAPSYAQKSFASELKSQDKTLVVSRDGRQGSITIQQDADLYIARLATGKTLQHEIRHGRGLWLQFVKGQARITANNQTLELSAGDALAADEVMNLSLVAQRDSEFLLFDLS